MNEKWLNKNFYNTGYIFLLSDSQLFCFWLIYLENNINNKIMIFFIGEILIYYYYRDWEVTPTDCPCVDTKSNFKPILTYDSSPTATKQANPLVCRNCPLLDFQARI